MDVGLNGIPAYVIGISTQLILVYALFHQWFRFSTQTTLLVVAILKIMELCADEFVTDETRWVLAILAALEVPLLIPLMKKGMRRLMLIIYMIYAFIYNAFGGIVISAMTTVYGILAGKSNQTWFIGATMTQADFVLKWTGAALCYAGRFFGCRIRNLYYWAGAFHYADISAAAHSAAARKQTAANTDAGTVRILSKSTRNAASAA